MQLAKIENGTVVNVVDVDALAIPAEMSDWPVIPEGIGIGWSYDGEAFDPPVLTVTADQVNAERDRRLPLPFEFNGTLFDRDPVSLSRISGAGVLALGAIINGAPPGDLSWHGGDSDFGWIAYDGSIVNMDAQTVFAFGQAAARTETLIVFAAKALKSMDPIPADYADDLYWP